MSEKEMRSRLRKDLRSIDLQPVENLVGPGTPDDNYTNGWVELKWLRAWPKKPETPVTVDHYTPQQRVWAVRRRRRGGRCFLLLQVGREWLLFLGETAAEKLGHSTREALIESTFAYWPRGLNVEELIECLCDQPVPKVC